MQPLEPTSSCNPTACLSFQPLTACISRLQDEQQTVCCVGLSRAVRQRKQTLAHWANPSAGLEPGSSCLGHASGNWISDVAQLMSTETLFWACAALACGTCQAVVTQMRFR